MEIPTSLTTIFTGYGTNLLAAGARIDGIAQLGGYGGQQGIVPGLLEVAGSVTGAGSIRVLGEPNKTNVLKWTEGVLGCSHIMIDFGGSLRIGPAARTLSGCSLYNSGLCELFSADLTLANAALLKNNTGAVFEIAVPGVIRASATSPGSFYNGGLLRKAIPGATDFGTSASATGPAFSNSGTLEIQAGQMAFFGDWLQTGGLTSVDTGATITGKLLQLQAGVLSGPGTIQGKIDNAGTLVTGSNPGTLVLGSGSEFVQRASGKIGIQLGGTTAGTQYDVLRVQGPATLGGQVEIAFLNGYEPQPTDTFKILTASAITGKFASIAGTAPPGKTWVATYTPTEVILSLGTLATVSRPVYKDGRIGFAFATTPGATYTVEKSDSLNPIGWYAVQTYPGDGTAKFFQEAITPPEGYYRVTVK
jgi:hypothetical protein